MGHRLLQGSVPALPGVVVVVNRARRVGGCTGTVVGTIPARHGFESLVLTARHCVVDNDGEAIASGVAQPGTGDEIERINTPVYAATLAARRLNATLPSGNVQTSRSIFLRTLNDTVTSQPSGSATAPTVTYRYAPAGRLSGPSIVFGAMCHPMQPLMPGRGSASAETDGELRELARLLAGRRIAVLTGAGCSTESGIPDYRGPGTERRARNPIQYRAFMNDPLARVRYWARSFVGWPRFAAACPNAAHLALAKLEHAGCTAGVITQNVDGLHEAAGSRQVVELHGRLANVRCLICGARESRTRLQQRLRRLNPTFRDDAPELAPDGDGELPAELVAGFSIAACESCGGTLKPDVVFFGENVPKQTVDSAWALFKSADALLVVGSSLAVFSGFRFVREAKRCGMPIAMVNVGPSRGDALCDVRVEKRASHALSWLAARWAGQQLTAFRKFSFPSD
jgi:NAD-dependent SIR2 family protein deacetylase